MTDRPALQLADFAGTWELRRVITDRIAAGPPTSGRFTGTARFDPGMNGLTYHEQGKLRLGDGPELEAERRYLWRADGTWIAVLFDDGRPFHCFDPNQRPATARHDCAPDLYQVRYDLAAWPRWRVEWQVSGPRKDYLMVTDYVRG